MSRKTLQSLFAENMAGITQAVHVAVDVQETFAKIRGEAAVRRIGAIAPAFNKAGILTYWVYYKDGDKSAYEAGGGLYKVNPLPGDRLIGKTNKSAFGSSEIDETLKRDKKKILLVSGFYCYACVLQTAIDGVRSGYNVVLMPDCTDADVDSLEEMSAANVIIAPSSFVLDELKIRMP